LQRASTKENDEHVQVETVATTTLQGSDVLERTNLLDHKRQHQQTGGHALEIPARQLNNDAGTLAHARDEKSAALD
jgi:hypothetical protein